MKKKLKIWIDGKRIRPAVKCDSFKITFVEGHTTRLILFREVLAKTSVEKLAQKDFIEIGFIHGQNIVVFEK